MLCYLKCFNDVKLALLKKNRFTYITINRKNTIILNLLLKYNIIYGYKIININGVDIYLVFPNTGVSYYNIKNLHKLHNPRYIKYKDMMKLPNKTSSSKYILSTSKGFIELKEALSYKIGGILIFKIY